MELGNVASVGKHAFYGCVLTRADLSSAEAIGYGAFTGSDFCEVFLCLFIATPIVSSWPK